MRCVCDIWVVGCVVCIPIYVDVVDAGMHAVTITVSVSVDVGGVAIVGVGLRYVVGCVVRGVAAHAVVAIYIVGVDVVGCDVVYNVGVVYITAVVCSC